LKESIVDINNHQYRYGYDPDSQRTRYLGPVGDSPELCEEDFQRLFLKKGKWVKVEDPEQREAIRDYLYLLVETSYAEIGGHSKVKTPADIELYDVWYVLDHDQDELPDAVLVGRDRSEVGVKLGAIGTDRRRESVNLAKEEFASLTKTVAWGEVSGTPAASLIKRDVPVVTDPELVKELLGKDIIWYGQHPTEPPDSIFGRTYGWYGRKIDDKETIKLIMGIPGATR